MKIKRFQSGGSIPATQDPANAPQAQPQGQGGDPLMEIANIFMQGLQTQNCELLAQGAQAFLMLLQQAQRAQQAPVGEPQGEPVFKKGGKICGRKKKVKKDCDGGKVAKNCGGGSFKKCNGGTMKK